VSRYLLRLPTFVDVRGALTVADGEECLPFPVARYFIIRDVPAGETRGRHQQLEGHELISCVAGACTVELRGSDGEATFRLDGPEQAVHVPPRTWVECRELTPDAVLLVLCSNAYDPLDQVSERP
jgi:UDP-2-acetamido-3-amino-2,3-dideoxy-glucuronate N-acetyltransferase